MRKAIEVYPDPGPAPVIDPILTFLGQGVFKGVPPTGSQEFHEPAQTLVTLLVSQSALSRSRAAGGQEHEREGKQHLPSATGRVESRDMRFVDGWRISGLDLHAPSPFRSGRTPVGSRGEGFDTRKSMRVNLTSNATLTGKKRSFLHRQRLRGSGG